MTAPAREPGKTLHRAACEAMGCRFEICITDPGCQSVNGSCMRAACEEAIEVILDWHARLNAFDDGSVVSLLNEKAGEFPVRVSNDVMSLLLACQHVHEESEGAFDITVGPLMRRFGFRGDVPRSKAAPVWGMEKVRLDPASGYASFAGLGVELDLGGVAKGLALDDASEVLREAGIRDAILHGGTSTVIAIGPRPKFKPFRIALGSEEDAPVVELRDSAISVSTPHGRVVERDYKTTGHVIDPRTGEPTDAARIAAALGSSALLCDAWSTALLVLTKAPTLFPRDMTSILNLPHIGWTACGPGSNRIRFHTETHPRTPIGSPRTRDHD